MEEKVEPVTLTVKYDNSTHNGCLSVSYDYTDFDDMVIIFAAAMQRNAILREIVKQSIDWMTDPLFLETIRKAGL